MSRVTNAIIVTNNLRPSSFITEKVFPGPSGYPQTFAKIATDNCGGGKALEVDVYAAAFSHVPGSEIEAWFRSLPVGDLDWMQLTWETEDDLFGTVLLAGTYASAAVMPVQGVGVSADERVDAIRARLRAATPGPWEWRPRSVSGLTADESLHPEGSSDYVMTAFSDPGDDELTVFDFRTEDAELIANAPADLAFLLEETARLREELGLMRLLHDLAHQPR